VKTPTPHELSDDNKRSLPQVQTSNWLMSDRSTPMPCNKDLWRQRGGTPPQSGPVFRAKTKQLTRAKFVSYFNLEQRFEQGAGGPAEGACEPEIAYAAWIWPFSLASNPAGPPEKIELP
jgi:hypothetical protein